MAIENEDERADKLAEFNVIQQVNNLKNTTIVQNAWKEGEYPYLHGWILELKSGHIKQIVELDKSSMDDSVDVFKYSI